MTQVLKAVLAGLDAHFSQATGGYATVFESDTSAAGQHLDNTQSVLPGENLFTTDMTLGHPSSDR